MCLYQQIHKHETFLRMKLQTLKIRFTCILYVILICTIINVPVDLQNLCLVVCNTFKDDRLVTIDSYNYY